MMIHGEMFKPGGTVMIHKSDPAATLGAVLQNCCDLAKLVVDRRPEHTEGLIQLQIGSRPRQ